MKYPIRIDSITSALPYYNEVVSLIEESKRYLGSHEWCRNILNGWLFTNLGKVICVFLYEVENSQSPDDSLIWVIVGDFPPMYLDTYNVANNKEAIEVYIELVDDWINHVEADQPLDECFPLASDLSVESSQRLKKRTRLLQNTILPEITPLPFTMIDQS